VPGQSVLPGGIVLLSVIFRGGGFSDVLVKTGVVLLIVGSGIALAGALALGRNLTPDSSARG
jgi:hypothetical protein